MFKIGDPIGKPNLFDTTNTGHHPSAIPIIRNFRWVEIDGSKAPHPRPSSTTGRLPHRHQPEPPATAATGATGNRPKAENTTGSGKRRRSDSLTIGD